MVCQPTLRAITVVIAFAAAFAAVLAAPTPAAATSGWGCYRVKRWRERSA